MNSSPHIRSSLCNPPHAASSGKRPITIPNLSRHPTRRLPQHPEHNASLYSKLLSPAPPLPPHQFNMCDTDFHTQDLYTRLRIPFNAHTPHIGLVSLERLVDVLPANAFRRTHLALAQRAFEGAAWLYDRALYEQGGVVLERFLELLGSDSQGNTTVGEVERVFCVVAAEGWGW